MNVTNEKFAGLLDQIMITGFEVDTRNSITKRVMNQMVTFNDTPLISVRNTSWKNALREMEWFLSGSNNIKDLHPKVHCWWKPWANESGFIHNNYGKQFRRFDGAGWNGPLKNHHSVDQIQYMMDTLKDHPFSRRNVITTWHTHDMMSPNTPITNCHGTMIQCFVEQDDSVHMTMYQRSCDMILGVPRNWIQYWALLMYLTHQCGRKLGSFTWIGGDCHIYKDHYSIADTIVKSVRDVAIPTAELVYNPTSEIFNHQDFSLDSDYKPFLKESVNMVV